jgi:hypothetical protein
MITSTTVSPSPRDLVAKLSDDEKVGIDLLLSEPGSLSEPESRVFATLVPDERRRRYLRTLAAQLAALGISVLESEALDEQTVTLRDYLETRSQQRRREQP